jgi:hypothetical protein
MTQPPNVGLQATLFRSAPEPSRAVGSREKGALLSIEGSFWTSEFVFNATKLLDGYRSSRQLYPSDLHSWQGYGLTLLISPEERQLNFSI